jgi:hypothetical protein
MCRRKMKEMEMHMGSPQYTPTAVVLQLFRGYRSNNGFNYGSIGTTVTGGAIETIPINALAAPSYVNGAM